MTGISGVSVQVSGDSENYSLFDFLGFIVHT